MPAVVRMTVKNAPKIISPNRVAAAVETAEGRIEGEIPAENIAPDAVETGKIANGAVTRDKIAAGAVTRDKIAAGAVTAAALAGVLVRSVAQATKQDTQSLAAVSWTVVSGLELPVILAAGERVLLVASVVVAGLYVGLRITRDGAAVSAPVSYGARRPAMTGVGANLSTGFDASSTVLLWVDAPSTAGTYNYAVEFISASGDAVYVNRGITDDDNSDFMRSVSTFVAVKLGPEATL